MINIPFVPQQYPDEILGSWLARTALLNGRGAWRTLLEDSGYSRNNQKPLFDMPDYDPKINTLLNHLGCTYEHALLNLTTFQYWASFQRSRNRCAIGTSKVNALVARGKVITHLSKVGNQFSQSLTLNPYFCSLCIISDLTNIGEPYWHKSHQLPTVYYCPTHHILLQNRCTNCAMSNQTSGKSLMPLPSLICSCGFDFRKPPKNLLYSDVNYQRLTKVSMAALNSKEENWCADNVNAYFKKLIEEYLKPEKGRIYSKIKNIFKTEDNSLTRFSLKAPGFTETHYFNKFPSLFKSPEFCLILASLNIEFLSASKHFYIEPTLNPNISKLSVVVGVPKTIDIALAQLSDRIKRNPNCNASQYKMLYWYLRINDEESLRLLLPKIWRYSTPTIQKDRLKIESLLSNQKKLFNESSAYIRATIRDNQWLEGQKKQKKQLSKNTLIFTQLQLDRQILEKLKHIVKKILDNENRPERITLIRLGAYVNYSARQIYNFAKNSPELKSIINKVNGDKTRRQLVWAAKELRNEGVFVSAANIYRKAGLPFSPLTNGLVKQLTDTY